MNREELIAAMQVTATEKPRPVEGPGWGTVFVKDLTVAEADDTDEKQFEEDKKNHTRIARAAARVICDESGNRMFNPDVPEDVALLSKQPWKLLRKIVAEPEDGKQGN